jgi:hypothetical protein
VRTASSFSECSFSSDSGVGLGNQTWLRRPRIYKAGALRVLPPSASPPLAKFSKTRRNNYARSCQAVLCARSLTYALKCSRHLAVYLEVRIERSLRRSNPQRTDIKHVRNKLTICIERAVVFQTMNPTIISSEAKFDWHCACDALTARRA